MINSKVTRLSFDAFLLARLEESMIVLFFIQQCAIKRDFVGIKYRCNSRGSFGCVLVEQDILLL